MQTQYDHLHLISLKAPNLKPDGSSQVLDQKRKGRVRKAVLSVYITQVVDENSEDQV